MQIPKMKFYNLSEDRKPIEVESMDDLRRGPHWFVGEEWVSTAGRKRYWVFTVWIGHDINNNPWLKDKAPRCYRTTILPLEGDEPASELGSETYEEAEATHRASVPWCQKKCANADRSETKGSK